MNKTKIIPINYPDDLEKVMMDEKIDSVVGIEEMSITYIQPADTNSSSDDVQLLKVTTRTATCTTLDDSDAFYFDLEIPEGSHWSIDSGDQIKAIIDDFTKRLKLETEYETVQCDNMGHQQE